MIVECGLITDQLKLFLFNYFSFYPLASRLLLLKWLDSLQGCVCFSRGLGIWHHSSACVVWEWDVPCCSVWLEAEALTCSRENRNSPHIGKEGKPQVPWLCCSSQGPQASAEQSFAAGVCLGPKAPCLLCEHVQCVLVGVRSTSHTALPGGNTILERVFPCIPFL